MKAGKALAKGAPREIVARFAKHTSQRLAEWGATHPVALSPPLRKGDGRASILSITTVNEHGQPAIVWHDGTLVGVRIQIRYDDAVDDPVVGILIRTRIG